MTEVQATGTQAVVRNISDTARWAAVFRAREMERADALFRDPYAERLAGKMGVEIANTLPEETVTRGRGCRTYLSIGSSRRRSSKAPTWW